MTDLSQPTQANDTADASQRRREIVISAVEQWKSELIDLTARNNLLYYRDLRVGTLDLSEHPQAAVDLLAGRMVQLADLTSDTDQLKQWTKRAKAIGRKADEAYEEKGLASLFLAIGMATWEEKSTSRKSEPAAPICLLPVTLRSRTGGIDFELSPSGDLHLNPTLIRKLHSDFQVEIDQESIDTDLSEADSLTAYKDTVESISEFCRDIPGFSITERIVLGNFSYEKLPIVRDLDTATEELIRHELVAALAGDEEARRNLRIRDAQIPDPEISAPDTTPPSIENLVLDADSSQSYVINAVLNGKNLLVQGPPGTGKSQTISNLIASLIADGKTVLFVAEKRAAIDAVFKQLAKVGLDHLLLDMHSGQTKRGDFAKEIASSLEAAGQQGAPDLSKLESRLVSSRDQLVGYSRSISQVRHPWGISVYQARIAALEKRDGHDAIFSEPLVRKKLLRLTEDDVKSVLHLIEDWRNLGAEDLYASNSTWLKFQGKGEEQRDAIEAVEACARALDQLIEQARRFCGDAGLLLPESVEETRQLIGLGKNTMSVAEVLDDSIYGLEGLEETIANLKPLRKALPSRLAASLGSASFRRAKAHIRPHLKTAGERLSAMALSDRFDQIIEVKHQWSSRAVGTSLPTRVDPTDLEVALSTYVQASDALNRWLCTDLSDSQFDSTRDMLSALLEDKDSLFLLNRVRALEERIASKSLPELVDALRSGKIGAAGVANGFERSWLEAVIDEVKLEDPVVGGGRGPKEAAAEFRALDRKHIHAGAQRVRRACAVRAKHVEDEFQDEAFVVARQSKLRPRSRKHLPVRRYFKEAPNLLRALKPCWAMSPLVVSQMLPAERDLFDVVIFDEASQVTPADAITAVLRGKQLVVAGDRRQLPPTSFFLGTNVENEDTENTETSPSGTGTRGFESILDSLTGLIPEKSLDWHYRSRDEKLIAFSNTHIYSRSLTTFPGVGDDETFEFTHVPWNPKPSDKRVSPASEVDTVVDAIIDHARNRPEESLGVITMGIEHANRISDQLDIRLKELRNSSEETERIEALEEFFSLDRSEPCFIKNIERVQGDERDSIILSVGYGLDPITGAMRYHFGPIGQEGGERRLNVAVTRAKKRIHVVSSIKASDFDEDRITAEGTRLLRDYLAYAESKGTNLSTSVRDVPQLNAFEIQVRDALEAQGLDLKPQHGVSRYVIDFAVKHPERPGEYVLAIECDGASYHSTPTARERDRLRQEQLERLGWTFHRIWSTDWFRDPDKEVAAAIEAYERSLDREEGSGIDPDPFFSEGPFVPQVCNHPVARFPRPPVSRTYDPTLIADLIDWIESDTLPRSSSDLFSEVFRELGFKRNGPRITAAIKAGMALVGRQPPTLVDVSSRKQVKRSSNEQSTAIARGGRQEQRSRVEKPDGPRPDNVLEEDPDEVLKKLRLAQQGRKAVCVVYQSKSASIAKTRVITPLETEPPYVWAFCHKSSKLRCFKLDRVKSVSMAPRENRIIPPEIGGQAKRKARVWRETGRHI